MADEKRRWPWVTSGDRLVLALVFTVLTALVGVRHWHRAGVGRPEPVVEASARLESHRVDVNSAPWWELQALRGLGETKAKEIVAFRERNGPFADLEELRRVRGIGPHTLEQLRPYLKVKPPPGQSDEERF